MAATLTWSESNRAPFGIKDDKSKGTARCYHVSMDQNLYKNVSNTLFKLC